MPADRFFGAAPEVLRTLRARVKENALDLARNGVPRPPFYLTGNAGGQSFSVHAEGERVILQRGEGEREEIELASPKDGETEEEVLPEPLCPMGSAGATAGDGEETLPPGRSPLDDGLERLEELLGDGEEEGGEA